MKISKTPLEVPNHPGLGVRRAFRYFARQLGGAVSRDNRTGQAVSAINSELQLGGRAVGLG